MSDILALVCTAAMLALSDWMPADHIDLIDQ